MNAQALPDGFDYVGTVYRPPGEAHNILIQATVGCSHNLCTFCASHLEKRFKVKDKALLEADLRFAERYCRRQDRVFVLDADALCLPMESWVWLLENIRARLPWVRGVAAFATGQDIAGKSDADLARLFSLGLDLLYLGVESGHEEVLKAVKKGIDPQGLLQQGRRARAAGMALNISVLLGIADSGKSLDHARSTGAVLSGIAPEQVTVMTLIPQPGTVMHGQIERGELRPPDRYGLLRELREMLLHTDLGGGLFDYGHSSALLSFRVRLPEEKARGLECIDAALAGRLPLREEARRRL